MPAEVIPFAPRPMMVGDTPNDSPVTVRPEAPPPNTFEILYSDPEKGVALVDGILPVLVVESILALLRAPGHYVEITADGVPVVRRAVTHLTSETVLVVPHLPE